MWYVVQSLSRGNSSNIKNREAAIYRVVTLIPKFYKNSTKSIRFHGSEGFSLANVVFLRLGM